jgi:protein transport protein SEC24
VGPEGFRYDHNQRVELNHSVVEFVASPEFMHRPPQAPIYVFAIDVSYTAVASGMVLAVCNSILQAIKHKLSTNERTKVGFVTYDSAMHFYNLRSSLSKPQMLVVSEIEAPFVPSLDDLLVNLRDSMPLVEMLLTKLLPNLFKDTQDTQSAMGPALQCAYKIMASEGGKLVVFQSTLPSIGAGKLLDRQAANNDPTGRQLMQPGDQYYKTLALELSKVQIGCDLFFFAPKYVDVATIGCLSKFTGGEVNHYQLTQNVANEVSRLQNDVYRTLTRNTGFEALMRVRCSKGLSIDSHVGSFFLRAQDLMTLPNIDSDKSFTLKLKINDVKNFLTPKNQGRDGRYYATVQAGLLYTTFNGERRIRIITKCCPITDQVDALYRFVDERACMATIAKLASAKAIDEGLPKAINAVKSSCSNILSRYGALSGPSPSGGGNLMLPNTLLRFPLYMLATFKNPIFRADIPVDIRMAYIRRFETLSDEEAALWIHPNLYNLANFTPEVCSSSKCDF